MRSGSVLAAATAAGLLALVAADCRLPSATLDTDGITDLAFFRGFGPYQPEGYRLAEPSSELVVPGLWAGTPVEVVVAASSGTGRGQRVAVYAEGERVHDQQVAGRYGLFSFTARSDAGGTLRLRFQGEARGGGVKVAWVKLAHAAAGRPPWTRLVLYVAWLVVAGAVARVCGLGIRGSVAVAAVAALAVAASMVASRIHALAYLPGVLAAVAAGLVLGLVLHRLVGLSRDASAWVIAAFALRLLGALHPAFPSIDASFHAHNLWSYQGGGTARAHVGTATGPVDIPYPPLLYAVLSPVATRDVSGETLVRVTVAVLEGTAPLAVFALLLAGGASRRAASLGAAALAVMPEGLLVVAKGIGANSLGGWVALWALVAVLRRGSPVVTACVLALAFLGHPGSAAALVGLLVLWMTWTAWSDPDSRRGLARTALATVAGAVLAWLAYYRQAFAVTVKGLGRFGAEIAGGASFVDRQWPVAKAHALKIAQNLLLKFGGGPVVLAWAGLRRADAPRPLRTLLPPWFVGAGVLALLAVLTPFALRFEHFLAPGMAAAAGLGAEAWEQRGRHGLVSSLIAVSFALQLAIGVLLLLDRFTLISVIIPSPNWSWPFRL